MSLLLLLFRELIASLRAPTISNREGRIEVPLNLTPPPDVQRADRLLREVLRGYLEPEQMRTQRWQKIKDEWERIKDFGGYGPAWNFDWETKWSRRLRPLARRIGLSAVAGLLLLAPSTVAHAAGPYYISTSGNDSTGTGTIASPWRTYGHAEPLLTNNDVVIFRVGTYPAIVASRTLSNITITNNAAEAVAFEVAHGVDYANNAGTVLQFTNYSNLHLVRSVSGGSIVVRHTGNPQPDLTMPAPHQIHVGNAHINYAGVRLISCPNSVVQDVEIGPVFSYGIAFEAGSQGSRGTRLNVHGTATDVRVRADDVTIEDSQLHDTHYMLRDGTQANTGAEGVAWDQCSNWVVSNCDIYEHWSVTGSYAYGMDGGAFDPFNIPNGGGGAVVGCRIWNNHGGYESGNNLPGGFNGGGPNAEIAYNTWYGRNDYQPEGAQFGGSGIATTPFMLNRAMQSTDIHHNVFDIVDGASNNSGFRTDQGGTYGTNGDVRFNTIRDNIITPRFQTPVYNFNATGLPAGSVIENNIIYYRVTRGTGIVFAMPGTTNDYPLHTTGVGAAAKGAPNSAAAHTAIIDLAVCQGDIWGDNVDYTAASNPLFVDPDNATLSARDYHLTLGSPAIGTASDGGDRGAFAFSAPTPSPFYIIHDTFSRTVAPGGVGTPDVAPGAYVLLPAGSPGRFQVNGSRVVISPSAAGQGNAIWLPNGGKRDIEMWARWTVDIDAIQNNAILQTQLVPRGTADDQNGALFDIQIRPADNVFLIHLVRRIAGVQVQHQAAAVPVTGAPPAFVAGTLIEARYRISGANPTRHRAKVWRSGDAEPVWQLIYTESVGPQVANTHDGIRFQNNASDGTPSFPSLQVDEWTVVTVSQGRRGRNRLIFLT